jgi:hypothetical protein
MHSPFGQFAYFAIKGCRLFVRFRETDASLKTRWTSGTGKPILLS